MAAGTLTKTASDRTSFTYKAADADGVYLVEAWYATDDLRVHRYLDRRAAGCPGSFTVTFAKEIRLRGRRPRLRQISLFDCLHQTTGEHGMTEFAIGADGAAERKRERRFPHHTQILREEMRQAGKRLDLLERRLQWILLFLILLALWAMWSALGPLFG